MTQDYLTDEQRAAKNRHMERAKKRDQKRFGSNDTFKRDTHIEYGMRNLGAFKSLDRLSDQINGSEYDQFVGFVKGIVQDELEKGGHKNLNKINNRRARIGERGQSDFSRAAGHTRGYDPHSSSGLRGYHGGNVLAPSGGKMKYPQSGGRRQRADSAIGQKMMKSLDNLSNQINGTDIDQFVDLVKSIVQEELENYAPETEIHE